MKATRICGVEECESPHDSRGFCKKHARLVRLGRDPRTRPPTRLEIFMAGVRRSSDGCWRWQRKIGRNGYGVFGLRSQLAHRVSYEMFIGPIPDGLQIDHLCRVRSCVNPAHLEAVTVGENCRRRDAALAIGSHKTQCPHGHEYTEENTRRAGGRRFCRTCARDRAKAHYWARKATS